MVREKDKTELYQMKKSEAALSSDVHSPYLNQPAQQVLVICCRCAGLKYAVCNCNATGIVSEYKHKDRPGSPPPFFSDEKHRFITMYIFQLQKMRHGTTTLYPAPIILQV